MSATAFGSDIVEKSENCKNSISSLQTNALNYFLKQSEENETSEASDTHCDTIENSQIMDVPISR